MAGGRVLRPYTRPRCAGLSSAGSRRGRGSRARRSRIASGSWWRRGVRSTSCKTARARIWSSRATR
eukprot:1483796-Lingulodinium_polyedra.AAC.1